MKKIVKKIVIKSVKDKAKHVVNSVKDNPDKWKNTVNNMMEITFTIITFTSAFKNLKGGK